MSEQATLDLPRWDLSDLYMAADDPKIDEHLAEQQRLAEEFEKNYKSRIAAADLEAPLLAQALDDYESLARLGGKIGS
ncbi:MAG: oligoendopeptidase F, partial [Candidatus Eremiobacteraeota bacterium]|nr:oligoendopeptidase F [Candidatus Eremiobacteraeota bacterium]